LINELGFNKNQLWITIFKGNNNIPRDDESEKIWQEFGFPAERIKEFGEKHNFWGPVGKQGVCGPNSEIYYDKGEKFGCGKNNCGPNCAFCQRFVEIWNLVFIQYYKQKKGKSEYEYVFLPQKSIDTGMGFERTLAILQKKPSAYETDIFYSIIKKIEEQTNESYSINPKPYRIIADHLRGICFLITEGILPSNIKQGYILRRLIRRTIRYGRILNLNSGFLIPLTKEIIKFYKDFYPELKNKQNNIISVIKEEQEKFTKGLERGMEQFNKFIQSKIKDKKYDLNHKVVANSGSKIIDGEEVFNLYQNYGFPLELTKELAAEKGFKINEKGFRRARKKHQIISKSSAEKKFGGHGIKNSEQTRQDYKIIKLHTAAHLLHASLQKILGKQTKQMGSDINEQRLRFDFSFHRKLTGQEIKDIEDLVNQNIKKALEVKKQKMTYADALKSGALAFFKDKYPDIVSVYSINDFSKEICAGPHIKNTREIGIFKIIKEQSSSSGVRRIKAIIE